MVAVGRHRYSARRCAQIVLLCISLLLVLLIEPTTEAHAGVAVPTNGVVLDGYGGMHPFGNLSLNTTGAPYWSGWDIARSISVLPDGSGGWTLDGFGGIHHWGTAPAIQTPSYWSGWDIARAVYVLPDEQSGYLLDGWGGLHPFGPKAVALSGAAYWSGRDVARGLDIHLNNAGVPDGGVTADAFGGVHTFGSYYPITPTNPNTPGDDVALKVHSVSGAPYVVSRFGILNDASGGQIGTDWTSYSDSGSWDILRDIVLLPDASAHVSSQPVSHAALAAYNDYLGKNGGVVLDGYGGLHAFGRAEINIQGAPYWRSWDIARSISVLPDGSGGWTLDGYGGIHNWGSAPAIRTSSYWSGWDIARAIYLLPDKQSGYLLDGWGGLHPFGPKAVVLSGAPYWHGWDVARGLDIHLSNAGVPDGGATLDAFGGVHTFGNYYEVTNSVQYWSGRDLYMQIHAVAGVPYIVQRWGQVDSIGGSLQPDWTSYSDSGSWNIVRDEFILGGSSPYVRGQPVSTAAFATFMNTAYQGFTSYTPLSFANAMLEYSDVDAPVTGPNQYALETWELAEGGGAGCDGEAPDTEPWAYSAGPAANPLNTTRGEPGATNWNRVGVKIFHDYEGVTCWSWGIKASGDTLTNGYYANIIATLQNPSSDYATQCVSLARAVGNSPWGTGDFERDC
jgi:hypothetical protein